MKIENGKWIIAVRLTAFAIFISVECGEWSVELRNSASPS